MRHNKIFFLIMMVLFVFLSGCQSEKQISEKKQMTIMHYKETLVPGLDAIIDGFVEVNANAEIKQEMIATEYNTVLQSKIQVNKTPDVFVAGSIGDVALRKYVENGIVADISELEIIKKLPSELIEPLKDSEGKIYVLPFLNTGRGIIYNVELFEKAGISELPKTLEEMKLACEKLVAIGVTPFAIAGAEGWSLGSIPWQVSQEIYSSEEWIRRRWEGISKFEDLPLETFDFFDLMVEFGNKDPIRMDFMGQIKGFAVGEYAMMAQGPWAIDLVIEIEPSFYENARMMAIPVSNDPSQSKLYYDNDLYFLVSTDADLELVDEFFSFIFEGEGREIFSKEVKILNAFDISFETHNVNQSIMEYVQAGNIITNFQYNHMPDGFWQSNAKVMQSYLLGDVDKIEALRMLDIEWDALTR